MQTGTVKTMMKLGVVALAAVLAVAGAVTAFSLPGFGKFAKAKVAKGAVSVPLADLQDGKARFYRHSEGGRDIAFFAVKAPNGSYRVAFDACEVCFQEKKGYVQDGGFMTCRQCNKKFATDRIGEGPGGGCNPAAIPARQAGGNLVISVADIRSGARFF